MSDWKLGRRHGGCVDCEREFQENESHHSLLSLRELDIVREDLCRACFERREVPDDTVWWKTRHTLAEKKGVQLDLESIHALFHALESKQEQGWRELRYLLCLILMRKRRLKVVGVKRVDGAEVFVVRKPRTENEEVVFVYDFTPERQAELRETLHAIFEGAELDELDPAGERRAAEAGVADGGPAPDGAPADESAEAGADSATDSAAGGDGAADEEPADDEAACGRRG